MTNEEQLLIAIKADTTNLMSGLKTASTGMDSFSKKISGIGKGMTIVGAAITAAFVMAIKTASKFEQSMANTASVAGATTEELKRMSDAARDMGEKSVYTASQAADAMYYLASAGMKADEVIGALSGTMTLAAATQSDLAYTSEAIAATLSQYNLEAEEASRVSNVFAAAISGSQATMVKLKESMSYVGPMAKSMGITLEETAGILMNLYNAGLEGAAAGTALRMAFAKLLDPTKATADAMGRLGVSITDSAGQMRPFKDIIDDLGKAGMTAADAMQIFGIRAGPGMLALVSQGTGAIQEMTDKVTDTTKATDMATTQMDTFQGSMKLLKSAFEEFQITLVQDFMPALRPLIDKITETITKTSDWIKANPELAATLVKVTALVGALLAVVGPLTLALPGLVTGIGLVKVALTPLNTSILLITANVIIWWNVIKSLDEVLHSHRVTIQDVQDAYDNLAKAQKNAAEKIGISVEEFVKMQKEGKTVSEMMDPLIAKYGDYADALNVWTIAAVEQQVNAKIIATTVKDITQEMSLLTKEYGAGNQAVNDSIKYYTNLIDLLNKTDVILQTELMLLEQGTEEWYKKKEEIADNTKALKEMNEELGKILEPLKDMDLITAQLGLLGDSAEDNKAKLALLGQEAVILKEKLEEAVPETQAWYDLSKALEENKNKIEELGKTYIDVMKSIEDRMYELTHTQRENEIRLLDEKKAKLIEIAKQAGLSAKEEIEAIKKILEYYQKELDILNKLEGIKAGRRYNIYKDGVNIASVGAEQAQHMLEEGYDVIEIPSNTPGQQPGQILSEIPGLATGTPLVTKSGIAKVHEGEGILTPEQNKAYQAGAKSYSPTIYITIEGDGDENKIKRVLEQVLEENSREFYRSGNLLIPGMA